jgi:hypothetical protein
MIALHIAGATHIMKGPADRADIYDLHVKKVDDSYVSRWEPTPEELAILNAGGSVELWVMGGQPPVALQVARHEDEQ